MLYYTDNRDRERMMITANLVVTAKQMETLSDKATQIGLTANELLLRACPVYGTTEQYGEWEGYCAIAVPWHGMWLCIEPDGHSHT